MLLSPAETNSFQESILPELVAEAGGTVRSSSSHDFQYIKDRETTNQHIPDDREERQVHLKASRAASRVRVSGPVSTAAGRISGTLQANLEPGRPSGSPDPALLFPSCREMLLRHVCVLLRQAGLPSGGLSPGRNLGRQDYRAVQLTHCLPDLLFAVVLANVLCYS